MTTLLERTLPFFDYKQRMMDHRVYIKAETLLNLLFQCAGSRNLTMECAEWWIAAAKEAYAGSTELRIYTTIRNKIEPDVLKRLAQGRESA